MQDVEWIRLVYMLLLVLLIAPAAMAMNRRTWLRNTVIWLAVLIALVYVYETFGPF